MNQLQLDGPIATRREPIATWRTNCNLTDQLQLDANQLQLDPTELQLGAN
jgi:hypothetical protein